MTPTATKAGVLFAPTPNGRSYLSRNDHRHTAHPSRNRWAATCLPQCEFEIFTDAEANDWRDDRPQYWGLRPDLPVIGTKGERIAKFPDPPNAFDPWHGYPVTAQDPQREWEHRPGIDLVQRWIDAGLVSNAQGARIRRGKV